VIVLPGTEYPLASHLASSKVRESPCHVSRSNRPPGGPASTGWWRRWDDHACCPAAAQQQQRRARICHRMPGLPEALPPTDARHPAAGTQGARRVELFRAPWARRLKTLRVSGSAAAHSVGISGDAPPSPGHHLLIALIYLIPRAGLRPYALQGDLARPRCRLHN